MGLYDDDEIVGREAALAERHRLLRASLRQLRPLIEAAGQLKLMDGAPRARSGAMQSALLRARTLVREAEARDPDDPDPRARALLQDFEATLEACRREELEAALKRRRDEMELLRSLLHDRGAALETDPSEPETAALHVENLAGRLSELAEAHGFEEAAELAATAWHLRRELPDGPAAESAHPPTVPPPWPHVETAISEHLDAQWGTPPLLILRETDGLHRKKRGLDTYRLDVRCGVLGDFGAKTVRLSLRLVRGDRGYRVDRCGVLA